MRSIVIPQLNQGGLVDSVVRNLHLVQAHLVPPFSVKVAQEQLADLDLTTLHSVALVQALH